MAYTARRKVGYLYDADCGNYYYAQGHPMKPHRMRMTHNLLLAYGLFDKMDMLTPPRASERDMTRFHSDEYINFLKVVTPESAGDHLAMLSRFNVLEDCPVFDGLWEYCQIAAGGSLTGAARLNSGESSIAINWAGGLHHAKKAEASGFCYINDCVLAILELLKVHARVLYVDIDIHHGDGVEEAFYTTDRVMTASFHKFGDYFPGTGDVGDIGISRGKYYSANFPLRDGIDDESYREIFVPVMSKIMEWYQPGAVVLQCGADSLSGDRLGCFNLSLLGHAQCVDFFKGYDVPLLMLGGGGYTIRNVARCWAYETSRVVGAELTDELPFNENYEFYGPEFRLHIVPSSMENHNTQAELERTKARIFEHLRHLPHAPSAPIMDVPRNSPLGVHARDIDSDGEDPDIRHKNRRAKTAVDYAGSDDEDDDQYLSSLRNSRRRMHRPNFPPRQTLVVPTEDDTGTGPVADTVVPSPDKYSPPRPLPPTATTAGILPPIPLPPPLPSATVAHTAMLVDPAPVAAMPSLDGPLPGGSVKGDRFVHSEVPHENATHTPAAESGVSEPSRNVSVREPVAASDPDREPIISTPAQEEAVPNTAAADASNTPHMPSVVDESDKPPVAAPVAMDIDEPALPMAPPTVVSDGAATVVEGDSGTDPSVQVDLVSTTPGESAAQQHTVNGPSEDVGVSILKAGTADNGNGQRTEDRQGTENGQGAENGDATATPPAANTNATDGSGRAVAMEESASVANGDVEKVISDGDADRGTDDGTDRGTDAQTQGKKRADVPVGIDAASAEAPEVREGEQTDNAGAVAGATMKDAAEEQPTAAKKATTIRSSAEGTDAVREGEEGERTITAEPIEADEIGEEKPTVESEGPDSFLPPVFSSATVRARPKLTLPTGAPSRPSGNLLSPGVTLGATIGSSLGGISESAKSPPVTDSEAANGNDGKRPWGVNENAQATVVAEDPVLSTKRSPAATPDPEPEQESGASERKVPKVTIKISSKGSGQLSAAAVVEGGERAGGTNMEEPKGAVDSSNTDAEKRG